MPRQTHKQHENPWNAKAYSFSLQLIGRSFHRDSLMTRGEKHGVMNQQKESSVPFPEKEHKQKKSTLQCTAMPTFGVAGGMLKSPHSINDEREEAGRHSVFSPQTSKTSNDPVAQMFRGLLIQDKYLTKDFCFCLCMVSRLSS